MAIVLEEKRPVFLSNWLLPSASESDVCAVRSAAIYVDVSNIKQVMSHMGGGEIVDPPVRYYSFDAPEVGNPFNQTNSKADLRKICPVRQFSHGGLPCFPKKKLFLV